MFTSQYERINRSIQLTTTDHHKPMYADEDISSIFTQCRDHYAAAAIERTENDGEQQEEEPNDENSSDIRQRGRQAGDGSSLSSIERSVGSLDASSGGYEASSSSSSSQTPNIANGRARSRDSCRDGKRGSDKNKRSSGSLESTLADVFAPGLPPTKSVSFTGNVKPPSSYNRKHSRGPEITDQTCSGEPACKAPELDTKERTARKSVPNDDNLDKSEANILSHERTLAQRQLLQGNEVTIEQAMTLCRQPR